MCFSGIIKVKWYKECKRWKVFLLFIIIVCLFFDVLWMVVIGLLKVCKFIILYLGNVEVIVFI